MKRHILIALVAAIASAFGIHTQAQRMDRNKDIDVRQLQKIQMAQVYISQLYVDSLSLEKVTEDAIRGMISKLDPHTSYSDPEETNKLNEPLRGNFGGIGVQFNMLDDSLIVIATTPKGPCEKAGILAGDRIISVNGETIAGVKMSRDSIMKKLRGPEGTLAKLQIVRHGAKKPLRFNIVRDQIPMPTLDAYYMLTPTIGYIHLDRFGATSAKELREAIKNLQKQGMQDLIFDLEVNGGGYLEAAIDIANEFLQPGDLIVFTEGRAQPRKNFYARGGGHFREGRLVILVDEFSASASEIVSGAVQDHDRGIIVGRRSFGKGLVQQPINLPDDSMIRLTTAHYYTPSGRCIQKPYEKGHKEDYEKDMENRYNHGELTSIDSIHLDSTKVYRTLREGRIVYGGGGIMPDHFVPLDTTKVTPFFSKLRRTDVIVNEVLRFIDVHRQDIRKQYPTFADFKEKFEVPQSLIDTIVAKAKTDKKLEPKDSDELKRTMPDLRYNLKAQIAYNLWDRNEYSRFANERNDIVKRALELLQNPS